MMKTLLLIILTVVSLPSFSQKERKYVREGNKLYEDKKYEKSEVEYRKALEKKPNSIESQYNLAGSLYKQKKFEDAANSYLSVTGNAKSKEEAAKYYHNLGNSYLQGGKLQESIEAYKNALRNNPKDEETRYNLAFAMDKLKQQQQQQQQQTEELKASEYAQKLKKQAEQLIVQRKYNEAYELMKQGEQKDKTVLLFKDFTKRINDVIKINE